MLWMIGRVCIVAALLLRCCWDSYHWICLVSRLRASRLVACKGVGNIYYVHVSDRPSVRHGADILPQTLSLSGVETSCPGYFSCVWSGLGFVPGSMFAFVRIHPLKGCKLVSQQQFGVEQCSVEQPAAAAAMRLHSPVLTRVLGPLNGFIVMIPCFTVVQGRVLFMLHPAAEFASDCVGSFWRRCAAG